MINESLVDNYSLQGAYIELTSECNLRCLAKTEVENLRL